MEALQKSFEILEDQFLWPQLRGLCQLGDTRRGHLLGHGRATALGQSGDLVKMPGKMTESQEPF